MSKQTNNITSGSEDQKDLNNKPENLEQTHLQQEVSEEIGEVLHFYDTSDLIELSFDDEETIKQELEAQGFRMNEIWSKDKNGVIEFTSVENDQFEEEILYYYNGEITNVYPTI